MSLHDVSRKRRVALVQMPFGVTSWPSLGLSLLKAILLERGHEAKIFYFNKLFAERIGPDLYSKLARGAPQNVDLAGEWAFSSALWGRDSDRDEAYFRDVLYGGEAVHRKPAANTVLEEIYASLAEVAARARSFIEDCEFAVDWTHFDVVGFTSTFQQHVAALALAKRLKARFPHLVIIFGGANCEAEMGVATLRSFPFVDAICLGEGDEAFPEFLERPGTFVEGILTRAELAGRADPLSLPRTRSSSDLNALPFPDFEDFFEGVEAGSEDYERDHRLIFESSRGCWWGQKNHCTFCGLNGGTMGFRQKTGERALRELEYLVGRYGKYTRHVTASDNIMPYNYFSSFLPRLADLKMEISLFYETKANLKKEQIEIYRRAGLSAIQPGIESLSTDVLRLMRKGVSSLQNIQLLKWCQEFGIVPKWNYLAGFPQEDAKSYAPIPALVRKLKHLTPPIGVSTLRFDRFSPYLSNPSAFSIRRLVPYPAYYHIYRGLPADVVSEMAYYFVGHFDGDEAVETYTSETFEEINEWKDHAENYALFHLCEENGTLVFDARGERASIIRLTGLFEVIFASCDGITSIEAIAESCGEREEVVSFALEELERRGLFVRENNQVLNLSIPLDQAYSPPNGAVEKLSQLYENGGEGEDESEVRIPQEVIASLSNAFLVHIQQHREIFDGKQ